LNCLRRRFSLRFQRSISCIMRNWAEPEPLCSILIIKSFIASCSCWKETTDENRCSALIADDAIRLFEMLQDISRPLRSSTAAVPRLQSPVQLLYRRNPLVVIEKGMKEKKKGEWYVVINTPFLCVRVCKRVPFLYFLFYYFKETLSISIDNCEKQKISIFKFLIQLIYSVSFKFELIIHTEIGWWENCSLCIINHA